MPESIKIAAYYPAHPAKDPSKTVPPKFKDGNDREFTIDKSLVDFVAAHQGQTVEAEYEETQNGRWTNRKLTGVTIPTTTPAPAEKPAASGGWGKSPDEAARICRQNALTNTVAAFNARGLQPTAEEFWKTAREFAAWNLEGIVPNSTTPEQRAAKEALNTGGSYAEALNKESHISGSAATLNKPHVAATLKDGESLGAAARRLAETHDPLADEEIPPPWVDETKPTREMLRPSRGAVR